MNEPLAVVDSPSTVPANKLDWLDISDETFRTYVYADGSTFRVDDPSQLNIKRGAPRAVGSPDSHRIRRGGELTNIYVAPGWIAIEWDGDYQF